MSYKSFKQILDESLSPIVYHNTTVMKLTKILHDNSLILTSSLGTDADKLLKSEKFKPYFLSTSRIKYGGYARTMDERSLSCIVLDGRLLNQRFSGGAVDYWGRGYRSDISSEYFLKYNENEDRLFSDKEKIADATKYIKEIHIMKHPDYIMMQREWKEFQKLDDKIQENAFRFSTYYKEISKNAAIYNIPVYFYNNFSDFILQNKSKADILTSSFDYLNLYIEILQKDSKDSLSKNGYEFARNICYYGRDDVTSLKNHIHNNRSDVYENKKLGILTRLMSKNKVKTLEQLLEFLKNKWRKILGIN